MLLHPVAALQWNQPHAVFIHCGYAPRQQRIADAGTDHAQQGEDVIDLHRYFGLEPGLLKHPYAIAMSGKALGEGDKCRFTQVAEIHLAVLGKRRVGGHSQEDIVGKQRQLLAVRVMGAFIKRHQHGVDFHVLELVQQVHVRTQNQIDIQLAAADFQAHDQLRHRLDGQ